MVMFLDFSAGVMESEYLLLISSMIILPNAPVSAHIRSKLYSESSCCTFRAISSLVNPTCFSAWITYVSATSSLHATTMNAVLSTNPKSIPRAVCQVSSGSSPTRFLFLENRYTSVFSSRVHSPKYSRRYVGFSSSQPFSSIARSSHALAPGRCGFSRRVQ